MLIVDKIYSRIEMAERFLLNINITKPNVKCFSLSLQYIYIYTHLYYK